MTALFFSCKIEATAARVQHRLSGDVGLLQCHLIFGCFSVTAASCFSFYDNWILIDSNCPEFDLCLFLALVPPGRFWSLVQIVRPRSAVPVLQVFSACPHQFQWRAGCSWSEATAPQDRLQRQRDEAVLCPGDVFEVARLIYKISGSHFNQALHSLQWLYLGVRKIEPCVGFTWRNIRFVCTLFNNTSIIV